MIVLLIILFLLYKTIIKLNTHTHTHTHTHTMRDFSGGSISINLRS